jgi:hypothetical protein
VADVVVDIFDMTSPGGMRPYSSWRRRCLSVSISALVAVGLVGAVNPAANAQGSLPRYLPTQIPDSFKVQGSFDLPGSLSKSYLQVLRDPSGTKEYTITGQIARSGEGSYVMDSLVSKGGKKVKVHGVPAAMMVEKSVITIAWVERNALLVVKAAGMPSKTALGTASLVVPSKNENGSFKMKKPVAGYSTLFSGPASSLLSSIYTVAWTTDSGLSLVEIVANVVPNFLELSSGPTSDLRANTTVNGKPAYSAPDSGENVVAWMEQPNLLIEIGSADLNDAAVASVAASVAPVTEDAFRVATKPAEDPSDVFGDTKKPEATSGPVAAGNVAGSPWVATTSGQCVRFAVGSAMIEVCAPAFLSPSTVAGKSFLVNAKPVAAGITGINVATVVFKANGTEIARVATQPVADQPGLRYFVTEIPTRDNVTMSGLDAAGVEIATAVPFQKVELPA